MKGWIGALLALALLLTGCGASEEASLRTWAPAAEQTMTVFTPLEQTVWEPLAREFERRSGVWVTVEQGSADDLLEQFAQNPQACDLLLGFAPEQLDTVASELETGPSGTWETVFYQVPVIVYNPHLIRKNPPCSLGDLTDPQWQGNLVLADPADHAFSRAVLAELAGQVPAPQVREQLERFHRNLAETAANADEVLERVRDGTCPMGVATESRALAKIRAGAELTVVYPSEGSLLLPAVAAVSAEGVRREHARSFLAFLTLEETRRHGWQSLFLRPADPELLPEMAAKIPEAPGNQILNIWQELEEGQP